MKEMAFLVVVIAMVTLIACASPDAGTTQPSFSDQVATVVVATMQAVPSNTPEPISDPGCFNSTADIQLLKNEEYGYCFLYPNGYVRLDPLPYEVCLVPEGPSMACHGANLMIEVQDALDRTVGQIANEMIAEHPRPEIVKRVNLIVDGEDGVVLDGLPGVAATRNVFIIHIGHLYHLTFIPWDESGDEFADMQTFYTTVINSFTFMP